jgi:hypothetical protein
MDWCRYGVPCHVKEVGWLDGCGRACASTFNTTAVETNRCWCWMIDTGAEPGTTTPKDVGRRLTLTMAMAMIMILCERASAHIKAAYHSCL